MFICILNYDKLNIYLIHFHYNATTFSLYWHNIFIILYQFLLKCIKLALMIIQVVMISNLLQEHE